MSLHPSTPESSSSTSPPPWRSASIEAHGYSLNDLVKCTVMLADISEWATFNEVYRTYFTDHFPARSAFGANGLALGARLEVECIAFLDE